MKSLQEVIKDPKELEKELFLLLYKRESMILKQDYIEAKKLDSFFQEGFKHFQFYKSKGVYSRGGVSRLIILLTHSCQLRCEYCSVIKFKADISEEHMYKGIDLLLTSHRKEVQLQFFGGEPLLKFPMIKKAVEYAERKAKEKGKKISFLMTTNGLLMTEPTQAYLSEHNFTIEQSIDGTKETQLKNRHTETGSDYYSILLKHIGLLKDSTINHYTISVFFPHQIDKLFENYLHLYDIGIRRMQLNYSLGVYWSDEDFSRMTNELVRIINHAKTHGVKLMNIGPTRREPVVLNSEITLDCDGTIFLETGICLEEDFQKLKEKFKLGHIDVNTDINDLYSTRLENFMALTKAYSQEKQEFRKIILSNIKAGFKLKQFLKKLPLHDMRNDVTLTLACNNDCVDCPIPDLSLICVPKQKVFQTIDSIREISDTISLTGGEVTILSDFLEIVSYCKRKGFNRIVIITNARKCKEYAFAKKMIDAGVNDITVSVYSSSASVHDAYTQRQGSFNETIAGIETLLAIQKESNITIRINTVLTSINIDSAYDLVTYLYQKGIRHFNFLNIVTSNEALMFDYSQLKILAQQVSSGEFKGATFDFRGFPLCTFNQKYPQVTVSKQDIYTTLPNNGQENYDEYIRRFEAFFTPISQCSNCELKPDCNMFLKAYVKKYHE